jgi:hypothetical protein
VGAGPTAFIALLGQLAAIKGMHIRIESQSTGGWKKAFWCENLGGVWNPDTGTEICSEDYSQERRARHDKQLQP